MEVGSVANRDRLSTCYCKEKDLSVMGLGTNTMDACCSTLCAETR